MQVGDIWELQGQVTTGERGCFFYGNKSIFKVDTIDTPLVPTKTILVAPTVGDGVQQSSPIQIAQSTTSSPTRSGVGSPSGAGNQTSNPRSGAGTGSGSGSGTTNRGAGVGSSGGSPTGAG